MASPEQIVEKLVKHLEESLVEHLKDEVKKMVNAAVNAQFEGINKRLDSITRTMDLWKSDLDEDRKTLQDLRVGYKTMDTELSEIRRTVDTLPNKVGQRVEESVSSSVADSVPQAVNDTFTVTNKKVNVEKKPRKKFLGIF